MFPRKIRSSLTAVLAACSVFVMVQEAHASLQVRLEETGFAPVTITDNGAGDGNPQLGVVQFVGSYGTFSLNTSVGLSKPVIGTIVQSQIDLSSSNVSTATGGTLIITLADTDFNPPAGNPITVETLIGGSLTAPAGSSVTFRGWVNPNNLTPLSSFPTVIPGGSVATTVLGPFGPGSYNDSADTSFNKGSGPFSIFEQLTLVMTGAGSSGLDGSTTATGNPNGSVNGRMTGGGSIFTTAGDIPGADIRITHGFELHCDPNVHPNNLEINVHNPANDQFKLGSLSSVQCIDDPNIAPPPPAAPFDTYIAVGTGQFNHVDGYTINFTFTDAGEPGVNDTATYLVWLDANNDGIVDNGEVPVIKTNVPYKLTFGNHQAHSTNAPLSTPLNAWSAFSSSKSNPNYWPPTGWSTNNKLRSAFSSVGSKPYSPLANDSLLTALSYPDGATLLGSAQILLRSAVAVLLSASHPSVGLSISTTDLQNQVNAALDSQNQTTIVNLANQLLSLDALRLWRVDP